MTHSATERLREDAHAIWMAALRAVDSKRLTEAHIRVENGQLHLGDIELSLDDLDRIAIVGGGKAGAGMAAGALAALGDQVCRDKQVHGWLNVPDDCVRDLPTIHLHGARPAGRNEPTQRGVDGTKQILSIVEQLGPRDLCLCLLSGGGSALLPAPIDQVPLEEKLELTRRLSGAGANIHQLNTVRKQLSRIKGGRLAQACRAGHLVVLVISDVMGDPLDIIASGPAIADPSTPSDALEVLRKLDIPEDVAPRAYRFLTEAAQRPSRDEPVGTSCHVHHHIIGNNSVAVEAAVLEARRRGYLTDSHVARESEGDANDLGRRLAQYALDWRANWPVRFDPPAAEASPTDQTDPREAGEPSTHCLVTGGEPTVRLAPADKRGRGGRNQQLVLAAYDHFRQHAVEPVNPCEGVVLLSGGTDGEDGPTDAAGAWIDAEIAERLEESRGEIAETLATNDAYTLLKKKGALLITGPTHTNVCDVRVLLVAKPTD